MTESLRQVLVMMAHPDDPDFFCGGTLARWVQEGLEVRYLLATSGDKGGNDNSLSVEQLIARREAEQMAAASVIGAREVVFMRHRDGALAPDLALRRQLARAIRLFRPDIIVTNDPQRQAMGDRRINHSDHRAIGEAVLAAVFPAAGNGRYFPELQQVEGLAPHTPAEVWLTGTEQPNHGVDITDFIEQKIAAIRQHRSQLTDPEAQMSRVRGRALQDDGRYAEQYKRIILR